MTLNEANQSTHVLPFSHGRAGSAPYKDSKRQSKQSHPNLIYTVVENIDFIVYVTSTSVYKKIVKQ